MAPCTSCACHLCTDLPKPGKVTSSVLQYLGPVLKGFNFPSASGPGRSQVGMEYTKGTAISGLQGGHLSPGDPCLSGQVLLGSRPWEGRRRSDEGDVESISDSPAAQSLCDGALLEELVRSVTREGRGVAG